LKSIRVGIAGLGLIGGSIGMALRASSGKGEFHRWYVKGYDIEPGARKDALSHGAIDSAAGSIRELARTCELLVIAVPTTQIIDTVVACAKETAAGTVITDCGSVKTPVLSGVTPRLPNGVEFIGGHPMAGSEKRGISAASPDLFRGATWALAEMSDRPASDRARSLVRDLVTGVGALPLSIDPLAHDETVAFTSHLQYILSIAIASTCSDRMAHVPEIGFLRGGAFRDMTRIARAAPARSLDYCLFNRNMLLVALEDFAATLDVLKKAVQSSDDTPVFDIATRAQAFLLGE
jgi:prephenate dehydrogenase